MARKFSDPTTDSIVSDISHAKPDVAPLTQASQKEIAKSKDIYLKPRNSIPDRMAFDEKYRADYEHDKEIVCFIAEHREMMGEIIEIWTKKYRGIAAEFWEVPTGKPVWGPRYLAEEIADRSYRRLKSENKVIDMGYGNSQVVGGLIVENVVQRLDAIPVNKNKKSIFMGSGV